MAAHDRRRRTKGNARCRFSGRSRGARRRVGPGRMQTGAPTLAVFAYWRGARLPPTPRIEAGEDAWFWGVPLPNGTYNTLAFVDPKAFGAAPGALTQRFLDALARSPCHGGLPRGRACRSGAGRRRDALSCGRLRRRKLNPSGRRSAGDRSDLVQRRPESDTKRALRAPSSPTPWFGGPKRPILLWAFIEPN